MRSLGYGDVCCTLLLEPIVPLTNPLFQECFHLISDNPLQKGSCAHLFHRMNTIFSYFVDNLVDKTIALRRDLGYTCFRDRYQHSSTKRHVRFEKLCPLPLFLPVISYFSLSQSSWSCIYIGEGDILMGIAAKGERA
jgi:hypothetical protein